jgi:hypothetical protein
MQLLKRTLSLALSVCLVFATAYCSNDITDPSVDVQVRFVTPHLTHQISMCCWVA